MTSNSPSKKPSSRTTIVLSAIIRGVDYGIAALMIIALNVAAPIVLAINSVLKKFWRR